MKNNVLIIGAGTMGSAIAKRLADGQGRIFVADKDYRKIKPLLRGRKIMADRGFASLQKAGFVIVAVKPQDISVLGTQLKKLLPAAVIIVSIAAGVTIKRIQAIFGAKKIVRVMPNLGLVVGEGIAAWKAVGLSKTEKLRVKKLLDAMSENFEVKNEALIDSVTAVSGSGPAYFFYLAAAMEKAARDCGLDAGMARRLVEKTFSAAARLQVGQSYDGLISRVASKKGTTEAALKIFDKEHLSDTVRKAVAAARKRARELSHE